MRGDDHFNIFGIPGVRTAQRRSVQFNGICNPIIVISIRSRSCQGCRTPISAFDRVTAAVSAAEVAAVSARRLSINNNT